MSQITFKISGGAEISVSAELGEKIFDLARSAGVAIDAPCSGNGTCGKCRVKLLSGELQSEKSRHISEADEEAGWRLACGSLVSGDAVIEVPAGASAFQKGIQTADLSTRSELELYEREISAVFSAGIARGCRQTGVGLAVDIGTTTVTGALLDLESGAILAKASAGNGQIRYGADVINRIINASRPGGREALKKAICEDTLYPLVGELCAGAKCKAKDITRCVIAGNTTMEHLFLGANADTIRLEPYQPEFLELRGKTAKELSLPFAPDAPVIFAPNMGSYVGGDISAGTLTTMLWDSDKLSLFVDLGTNGELVFGNRDFMLCCACSAGPAFEGGDISHGMRATRGAVEDIRVDAETMEPTLTIIGENAKPAGLCGSGIIDLISELFRCGIINSKGKFIREGKRIRRDEYEAAYIFAFPEESESGSLLDLTETDIDNFIRAKGAIFSAILTMLKSLDMTTQDIDRCFIAGGIGSGIDIARAISIGMLPPIGAEKYSYVGNTSLCGACAMLLSDEADDKVHELGRNMTYLELSTEPHYMDEFVAACFLPHTDSKLFEEA